MRISVGLLVVSLLLIASSLFTGGTSRVAAQDFSAVVAKSRPSIVLVFVERSDGSVVSGTGFAVTGSPALVTAAHVVEDIQDMAVRYPDGTIYGSKPVLVWHERDIALVRAGARLLPGLSGRGTAPRVGETAIVIGYPLVDKLGVSQVSVTQGIVSASRTNAIQLNVSVNPGNSGGPVLDSAGAVLGVVMSVLPGTGFAIASSWESVKTALDSAKRGVFPVAVQIAGTDEYVTGWIEQGTVLVDAKALAALLKGAVFWDPQSKTLTLAVGGMRLKFAQGSSFMDADGQRIVLPAPMTQDRKLPLKPIVAVLGGTVQVDTTAFRALIKLPQRRLVEVRTPAPRTPGPPAATPERTPSPSRETPTARPTPLQPTPPPYAIPGLLVARQRIATQRVDQLELVLELDKTEYRPDAPVLIQLTLWNRGQAPISLNFATSQFNDFVIVGPSGDEIARWSEGRSFSRVTQPVLLEGRRAMSFSTQWKQIDRGERPISPGRYEIIGTILSQNPRLPPVSIIVEKLP